MQKRKWFFIIVGIVVVLLIISVLLKKAVDEKSIISIAIISIMGGVVIFGLCWYVTSALIRKNQADVVEAKLQGIGVLATILIGGAGVWIAFSLQDQTKQAKEKEEQVRKNEIAPRLVFESLPARYDIKRKELVFKIRNEGRGRGYNLTVGLEHQGRRDETPPRDTLRWYKFYPCRDLSITHLIQDSTYKVRLNLESDFHGDTVARRALFNTGRFGNFKAYLVCTDAESTQYLTTGPLLPRSRILLDIPSKEFWSRLNKFKHPDDYYFPQYYRNVNIIKFRTE